MRSQSSWAIQVLRRIMPLLIVILIAGTVSAQRTITQDDVNAVAGRMYCPVCENVPLDDCGTVTCQAWKDEIRQQLAAGQTADAIIADFVKRYGEQVVGIPQDPVLRGLSLITPWVFVVLAVVVGVWTFRRWQVRTPSKESAEAPSVNPDAYRSRIEQDVD